MQKSVEARDISVLLRHPRLPIFLCIAETMQFLR